MDPNHILAPWGDAYQTPCSCGGASASAWIAEHPWLSLAIAAAVAYLLFSEGEGAR
jgi:ElaB/YqjD/DUF883 family membrane-anchored ribosome-binding protein